MSPMKSFSSVSSSFLPELSPRIARSSSSGDICRYSSRSSSEMSRLPGFSSPPSGPSSDPYFSSTNFAADSSTSQTVLSISSSMRSNTVPSGAPFFAILRAAPEDLLAVLFALRCDVFAGFVPEVSRVDSAISSSPRPRARRNSISSSSETDLVPCFPTPDGSSPFLIASSRNDETSSSDKGSPPSALESPGVCSSNPRARMNSRSS
mmetsp:Transcript_7298/g.22225  ORF Transcript_7298/g.22225 Transcript_7298/m.22225 type:complete len:207 (-) Transcript_7298:2966-3586(-)